MKARRIPLSVILSTYRPTDMLDDAPPDEKRPAALWPYVFASIERNHAAHAPAYWAEFRVKVAKRQRTPIKTDFLYGQHFVRNGHHRVWALFKAGAASVRAA